MLWDQRFPNSSSWSTQPTSLVQDWADREAPVMRCAVVHALELTKRTPKAKCMVIATVKNFLLNLIHQSGTLFAIPYIIFSSRKKDCF